MTATVHPINPDEAGYATCKRCGSWEFVLTGAALTTDGRVSGHDLGSICQHCGAMWTPDGDGSDVPDQPQDDH